MKKETAARDNKSAAAFQVDLEDAAAAQAAKLVTIFAYCHGFTSPERTQEKFNLHSSWRCA
jgi:hypothetical protein